jgi:hypothetical protein
MICYRKLLNGIADDIDRLLTESEATDEQQIMQEFYVVPARPVDRLTLVWLPIIEEIGL